MNNGFLTTCAYTLIPALLIRVRDIDGVYNFRFINWLLKLKHFGISDHMDCSMVVRPFVLTTTWDSQTFAFSGELWNNKLWWYLLFFTNMLSSERYWSQKVRFAGWRARLPWARPRCKLPSPQQKQSKCNKTSVFEIKVN